jgi:hypothetical protein
MRRRRRWLLWIAALGVLLAVALLSRGNPPRLPADADHGLLQAEAHCLTCHTRSSPHPRPADHPLRDDCFSCHRDPHGVLHPRPGAPTSLPGGWADDPVLAGRSGGAAGKHGAGR